MAIRASRDLCIIMINPKPKPNDNDVDADADCLPIYKRSDQRERKNPSGGGITSKATTHLTSESVVGLTREIFNGFSTRLARKKEKRHIKNVHNS